MCAEYQISVITLLSFMTLEQVRWSGILKPPFLIRSSQWETRRPTSEVDVVERSRWRHVPTACYCRSPTLPLPVRWSFTSPPKNMTGGCTSSRNILSLIARRSHFLLWAWWTGTKYLMGYIRQTTCLCCRASGTVTGHCTFYNSNIRLCNCTKY